MAGVSDEDRQRVVDELARRAAEGEITAAELADRTHRARSVITHAGLEGILLDLPAPSTGSHRPWALPGAPTPATAAAAPTATRQGATRPATTPPTGPPAFPPSFTFPPSFPPAYPPPRQRGTAAVLVVLTGLVLVGAVVVTLLVTSAPSDPSASPARPAPADDVGETVELAVGPDIRPGVYIAVPEEGVCHYQRTELLPGGNPDLVVAERTSVRLLIEVVPSDYRIRLRNCGPLQPYVAPATPATSLLDGDWLVGSDVVAGRYRLIHPDPDSAGCRWARAPAVGYAPSETVHLGPVAVDDPRAEVDLVDGERFSSNGCGLWERQ